MTTTPKKICVVDYGVGNLGSVVKALTFLGAEVTVSEDPEVVAASPALILPGVGSFPAGMDGLKARGLVEVLKTNAASGKPMLGICLGAQLMLERGYEFEEREGLGLIRGTVVAFPEGSLRVPHIGWNTLQRSSPWEGTILEGLGESDEVYFVHSFLLQPTDPLDTLSTTVYNDHCFVSPIRRGNISGCQFHPEKSGEAGLSVISNFLKML